MEPDRVARRKLRVGRSCKLPLAQRHGDLQIRWKISSGREARRSNPHGGGNFMVYFPFSGG
jgi:hypothetical protein